MGMACKKRIHASYHQKPDWNSINWKKVGAKVKKLQMRIAKAVRERRYIPPVASDSLILCKIVCSKKGCYE